jgi:hypothetical protein
MNTHAGYWDIDGDSIPETVVIGIGEYWTDDTPEKYKFEYENKMIVEGIVAGNRYIAFTPTLIDFFYDSEDFPNSLILMATCYACYDDSMAQVFLKKGAEAYMGWTQNTVFWTNSLTSVRAFKLLLFGFSVKWVCNIIRSGSIMNFLLLSKLTYYGNGNYKIS